MDKGKIFSLKNKKAKGKYEEDDVETGDWVKIESPKGPSSTHLSAHKNAFLAVFRHCKEKRVHPPWRGRPVHLLRL